jgi:hypothetical protein
MIRSRYSPNFRLSFAKTRQRQTRLEENGIEKYVCSGLAFVFVDNSRLRSLSFIVALPWVRYVNEIVQAQVTTRLEVSSKLPLKAPPG